MSTSRPAGRTARSLTTCTSGWSKADREIWFGNDGSGLIKTTRIGWSFFTDEQRTRWEASKFPPATESVRPVLCAYGPGGLSGPKDPGLAKLSTNPTELAADLEATRQLTLYGIAHLMGEALVPEQLRRALYEDRRRPARRGDA